MKNSFLQEIFVSLALIVLLILFVNPFELWMPSPLLMMMVAGFVVIFVVFASLIWRENARDEREGLHKMFAGRVAFLAGMGVLVLAVMVQAVHHALDIWVVLALGAMIIAKIGGLIYSRSKH